MGGSGHLSHLCGAAKVSKRIMNAYIFHFLLFSVISWNWKKIIKRHSWDRLLEGSISVWKHEEWLFVHFLWTLIRTPTVSKKISHTYSIHLTILPRYCFQRHFGPVQIVSCCRFEKRKTWGELKYLMHAYFFKLFFSKKCIAGVFSHVTQC